MTVAKTKPSKIDETALDSLRARLAELEQTSERMGESLAASRQRQDNLRAEREPFVLPARAHRDAAAQSRLRVIDEQLSSLAIDVADDERAFAELGGQLAAARNAITLFEWERDRATVREALELRAKGTVGEEIQAAASRLTAALDAAAEEDARMVEALFSFSPNLVFAARGLRELQKLRGHAVGVELSKHVPIDKLAYYAAKPTKLNLKADEALHFYRALSALDDLQPVL